MPAQPVLFPVRQKHDGQFVLRLDDTDRERSTQAFADAIQADLDWLGLNGMKPPASLTVLSVMMRCLKHLSRKAMSMPVLKRRKN